MPVNTAREVCANNGGMKPDAERARFAAFLDLRGRSGLVVGGGEVAAHKARMLLAAGARVTVVAPDACGEVCALAQRGALRHEAKRFEPGDLAGAEIAVAATGDARVNEAVAQAARALRVPVNVADNAELSSFIMAAIVDRAPVQIAISTGGASPVLARRIAKMIEQAVPEAIGSLAALAAEFRDAAWRRLPDTQRRRRFWEGVMDGPVARAALEGREAEARRLLEQALSEFPDNSRKASPS